MTVTQDSFDTRELLLRQEIEALKREFSQKYDDLQAELETLKDSLESHIILQEETERETIRTEQETADALKYTSEALSEVGGQISSLSDKMDNKTESLRVLIDTKISSIYSLIRDSDNKMNDAIKKTIEEHKSSCVETRSESLKRIEGRVCVVETAVDVIKKDLFALALKIAGVTSLIGIVSAFVAKYIMEK